LSKAVVSETSSRHIRFRGRSFPLLALEPESPVSEWIERLDAHLSRSPAFFSNKSIVVDVSELGLARSGVAGLVKDLSERGIRILGLTGVEPAWASPDLPPILTGGRAVERRPEAKPERLEESHKGGDAGRLTPQEFDAFKDIARALGARGEALAAKGLSPQAAERAAAAPLIVSSPVRSGQSISHPEGDVTVVGSVASGAEVIAGGSVHIYGTLRGRAVAGAHGEAQARIFCRRLEAELLAVGGVYITADEMDPNVRSQAVQAWLENESVKIARLD
jgi:septum site-determining protein MinC